MKAEKTWTAIYVRVSKADGRQDKGKDSQIHELCRYAKEHNLKPYRLYIDKTSGASDHLPKLALLGSRIAQGHVHTVLTSEISRFSRKGIRDGMNLITPWLEGGVRLISVAEGFDWSGTIGTLVASIFFWLAAQERRDIIRRTTRGLEHARAKGVTLGRPPRLHAKEIVARLKTGAMVTDTAAELGATPQALYACLRREKISLAEARGK